MNTNQNYIPLNVVVASPCNEDWNVMTDAQQGRFCASCSKTVYDFTDKSKAEVRQFFAEHKNEKVCGRFRESQVMNHQIDRSIFMDKLSVMATRSFRRNIIRYSFLVLVGAMLSLATYQPSSAAGSTVHGGLLLPPPRPAAAQPVSDTTMLSGAPALVSPAPDTTKAPEQAEIMVGTISVNDRPEPTLKGKPAFVPDSTKKRPRKPKKPVRPVVRYMMGDVAVSEDPISVIEPIEPAIKGEISVQPVQPQVPVVPTATPVSPRALPLPVPVSVPTANTVPNVHTTPVQQPEPPAPPVTDPVVQPVIH